MKKIIFNNERTMANAGAGKTFALTNRFISLVLGGAKPEEICALTFTRKAAGEFFNKTIKKLADAAASDKAADELANNLAEIAPELRQTTREEFEEALEKFVKSSPRLRLETIDAFTANFVKFFAAELGVNESVTILDDFAESKIKARALMLAIQKSAQKENFARFAEVIKEANNGSNEKKILSSIEKTRNEAHGAFIEIPDENKWAGMPPSGKIPPKKWDEKKYGENIKSLEIEFKKSLAALEETADPEKIVNTAKKAYKSILDFFEKSSPERLAEAGKIIEKIIANFSKNQTSAGEHEYFRKNIPIEGKAAELVDENLAMLFWAHVGAADAATKSIYKIISEYDEIYDELARKRGLMSFGDMTMSVAKKENLDKKELVEFRFDSKINHWLFDEFQDTSRMQWKIFENLIEEAVGNSDGTKTFFYVGDAKQAIYAWRGGDVSLFDEILEKFKGNIVQKQKADSFRSCRAIIDAVNKIFGDFENISKQYGAAAAEKWKKIWQEHKTAEIIQKNCGEVTMQILPKADKDCVKENIADAVCDYIIKNNPIPKDLTCAVLVQKNEFAEEIIEKIRARDDAKKLNIRAAGELDIKIAQDNIAIPPMYAMLKAAAHPADKRSLEFAKMSPLRDILAGENWRGGLISKISSLGFAQAMQTPAKILSAAAGGDAFTNLRIRQFLEAARLFDDGQNRNIDDFLDFISAYKIREGAASDTIQVMTIHKAKGLDFDIVILPQLGNEGGHYSKLGRNKKSVFVLPEKNICEMDEKLKGAYQHIEDEKNFEQLCKFYVAMTRTRHAIHMILPFVKSETWKDENEIKHNFSYLLRKEFLSAAKSENDDAEINLNCSELNDPEWQKHTLEEEKKKKAAHAKAPEEGGQEAYLCPQFDEKEHPQTEFSFDFLNRSTANLTGLAAHSIFENLAPKTPLSDAAKKAEILYAGCPENFADALAEVKKALENPQIKEVFECEDFLAELPYAAEIGGKIEIGRIDRVNFFENRARAEIIDFKTDAATPDQLLERHSAQLERYALALSKMSGIAPENIALKILSTHNASLIEVKAWRRSKL